MNEKVEIASWIIDGMAQISGNPNSLIEQKLTGLVKSRIFTEGMSLAGLTFNSSLEEWKKEARWKTANKGWVRLSDCTTSHLNNILKMERIWELLAFIIIQLLNDRLTTEEKLTHFRKEIREQGIIEAS